jgi:hypothetical protein
VFFCGQPEQLQKKAEGTFSFSLFEAFSVVTP